MIITRTPLRISLVGGGTDMPAFYERHGGACVSMAIDKYIYITFNRKFDTQIRLSYSKTEVVDRASQLKHDIARSCLEGIKGVEIASISDIPSEGSGLGSSSSFTVGLINAIKHFPSAKMLAEFAYLIEIRCGHHCGKQDHYAAAYGGLNHYRFNKDGSTCITPLLAFEEKDELQERFMLFWTGKTRQASKILKQQALNVAENGIAEYAALDMRDLANDLSTSLQNGDIEGVGKFLHENWQLKKKLAPGITDTWIDDIYDKAMEAGATGGKICGAGGGGFLLLFAEPQYHASIEKTVGLRRIPFKIEEEGSRVIYGRKD
jgi:D-glycero-alpha-D-manno-heptose-7-phosphate kinase